MCMIGRLQFWSDSSKIGTTVIRSDENLLQSRHGRYSSLQQSTLCDYLIGNNKFVSNDEW